MSKIKVMSELLSNKIAAGEVVERISSVVKELVENSIDAKSSIIKVELRDAGKTSIKVIDNGVGMDDADARICFQRHATSKLYKDDDLFFISTLGFRGEALPSIASVSEVMLETCNGSVSTMIHIKGGKILKEDICSFRKGTSIEVTNLFYNTPARLKFLKAEPSELANVASFIEKLALSEPKISFLLTNNNFTIVKTSGSGDLLKTIHEIYGLNVSENMLEIKGSNDDYDVRGYISKPIVQRSNKNHMITIINGRVIKNFEINKIINEAYHTYKPNTMYPITIINIDTDPTLIDVNIHPTKQDIKFSKMNELRELLSDLIKGKLYETMLIPDVIDSKEDPDDDFRDSTDDEIIINTKPDVSNLEDHNINEYSTNTFETQKSEMLTFDFRIADKNKEIKKLDLYLIGIALGTYIIAENNEGIFLIDQHAAQERVNYERVLKGLMSNESIEMIVPILIELSASDFLTIKSNQDLLFSLGFKFVEFGINTFRILEHPTWIKEGFEEDTIRKVFDTIINEEKYFDIMAFRDKVAATIACKASIKGNTRITLDEANFILEELVLCDNPYNCPHGRPTIIKFSIYELEKMFKRAM